MWKPTFIFKMSFLKHEFLFLAEFAKSSVSRFVQQ